MNLRDIVLNYLTDNEKGIQQLITWFLNDVMNEEVSQQTLPLPTIVPVPVPVPGNCQTACNHRPTAAPMHKAGPPPGFSGDESCLPIPE